MKMFRMFVVCIVFLLNIGWVLTCSAQSETTKENDIAKLVSDASKSYGKDYENLRDEIIKRADEARPILEKLRKDKSWDVRMTAYFLLGWMNHKKNYNDILADKGVGVRSINRPFRWGKYGIEIFPLLLERVIKYKEHDYTFDLEPKPINGKIQNRFEQNRCTAISYKLTELLLLADKELTSDLNILSPNPQINKFFMYLIDYSCFHHILPGLNNPAAFDVYPRSKADIDISQRVKIIINAVTMEKLQQAIKKEKDAGNKVTFYLALHLKGNNEALINLLKTVPDFKSQDSKLKALKVLGELSDKNIIPDLEELKKQVDAEEIKNAISEAIDKISIRSQAKKEEENKKNSPKPENNPDEDKEKPK